MTHKSKNMIAVRIEIRDLNHFTNIVRYLNEMFGNGKKNWRINVPVKRHLRQGKSIKRNILIRKDAADSIEGLGLFLSLM